MECVTDSVSEPGRREGEQSEVLRGGGFAGGPRQRGAVAVAGGAFCGFSAELASSRCRGLGGRVQGSSNTRMDNVSFTRLFVGMIPLLIVLVEWRGSLNSFSLLVLVAARIKLCRYNGANEPAGCGSEL